MTILLVLIPLGLLLLGLAIAAFVWAVRHGQFEELEGEGMRILLDEDGPPGPPGGARGLRDGNRSRDGLQHDAEGDGQSEAAAPGVQHGPPREPGSTGNAST